MDPTFHILSINGPVPNTPSGDWENDFLKHPFVSLRLARQMVETLARVNPGFPPTAFQIEERINHQSIGWHEAF